MSYDVDDPLFQGHKHICSICEEIFDCEEENCDETDDTAICEECLEGGVSDIDNVPDDEDY